MFIKKEATVTYTMELNEDEYKAIKTILNKLIFNHGGVSNQFKLPQNEIEVLKQIGNNLNFIR